MTVSQKIDLCDELGQMEFTLKKAQYVAQYINENYFGISDEDSLKHRDQIVYGFDRAQAFMSILENLLHEIRDAMPSAAWIERLQVSDDEEVESA